MKKVLSDKVISRLTLYHCILTQCLEEGLEFISSPQLSNLLKIDDSQVRKDIKLLNSAGKCKVGYNVKALKSDIEHTLGFENIKQAVIVGAGNLGMALAKYDNFASYGFNILALFDNDPLKVDIAINDKQVLHISKLPELTKKKNIEIAILTVPRKNAQECAEMLVKSGIKYIWNFSPTVLRVPEGIKILNENLIGNFLQFTVNEDV